MESLLNFMKIFDVELAKRTWESKHDETTTGTVSDLSDHADYTTASTPDQNTGPASNVNNITITVFTTHVLVFFWPRRHNFRDIELKFCMFS